MNHAIRIGADVGGTFTDVVVMDARGGVWTHKVPSTPPDFEQAVLQAVAYLLRACGASGGAVAEVAHGTTVATNAVLERRGALTALVTTKGFRDVLELRRIRAPQMYDLFFEKPLPLVERYLRFELTERMSATGEVLTSIQESELRELKEKLEKEGVESLAVCLLHAYAFPQHEVVVGDFLRRQMPGLQISLSSEVLRERKEYERTATTVVNAYVRPVMQRYLNAMRGGLRGMGIQAPLLIVQSAGGLTPEEDAAVRPVFVLESGPAAGVLAASFMARRAGIQNVITLDIGGTTAKASMIEGGRLSYSPEYEVGASLSAGNRLVGGAGELIRAPSIDIAEVGAGGGSIAYLDRAGGLRVGPRSAGAFPGPACYGRGGTAPTVTDANVALGYIRPGALADGGVKIDPEAAARAIHDRIAAPLGMDLLQAAEGIHRIANARTMRALRAVSTERGRDPRDFVLMAFGGSGPIHAAGLAGELYIRRVLVPPLPGLFSALGLLFSGVEHHDARSCMLSGTALTAEALGTIQAEMGERMLAQFQAEGYEADQVTLSASADVRFQGQASEIRIGIGGQGSGVRDKYPTPDTRHPTPDVRALKEAFEEEHERLYGHRSDPDNPVEVVAVRLVGRAITEDYKGVIRPAERPGEMEPSRRAYFGERWGTLDTPVAPRRALSEAVEGPLLIDEYDSTTVIPPGVRARLDEDGNIVMEQGSGTGESYK
ncbi:MAG: hydantoinase/oxoprolinase family protein [Candidatus Latescibacteria bacterium]|nr:hydantoinase/oxoprolinase family protein [Candidatus Latescibacterota bacterium]